MKGDAYGITPTMWEQNTWQVHSQLFLQIVKSLYQNKLMKKFHCLMSLEQIEK